MPSNVTISIEIELGWGMHDLGKFEHLSRNREAETETLERFLTVSERYNVPIPFDVIGHLLHASCDGQHSDLHPDGWWSYDPETDVETDSLFYAPDLISKIRDSSVDHEICTHTYSHALSDEFSPEALEWELAHSIELHEEQGLPRPRSLVMPRHQPVPFDLLENYGFETVRTPFEKYEGPDGPLKTLMWLHGRSHPLNELEEKNGVSVTRCTPHPSLTSEILPIGQTGLGHPSFRATPTALRQYIHRRYLMNAIDDSANSDLPLHLWTHLFNATPDAQWTGIKSAFEELGRRQQVGDINVKTMDELGS